MSKVAQRMNARLEQVAGGGARRLTANWQGKHEQYGQRAILANGIREVDSLDYSSA